MQHISLQRYVELQSVYIYKKLLEVMKQAGYDEWDIDESDGNVVVDGIKLGRAEAVIAMSSLDIHSIFIALKGKE